jgi:DNA-binding CsgD family transcriptional regulator
MHRAARLLAAEVRSSTGDRGRAAQWLTLTGSGPFPALRAWADVGVTRCPDRGWAGYDLVAQAAERGDDTGLACLLLRLGLLEEARGNTDGLARAAAEARRWRFGGPDLRTAEMVLSGLSERDLGLTVTAVRLLRHNGNAADLMRACLAVAALSEDPAPWYGEALEFSRRLGASGMGLHIKETMRKVGLTLPRARAARDDFSAVELRIITLVGQGRTNRQIATTVRMSEKTVEHYLTRLFVRTGCRSRLDLATASLEGRLGAVALSSSSLPAPRTAPA